MMASLSNTCVARPLRLMSMLLYHLGHTLSSTIAPTTSQLRSCLLLLVLSQWSINRLPKHGLDGRRSISPHYEEHWAHPCHSISDKSSVHHLFEVSLMPEHTRPETMLVSWIRCSQNSTWPSYLEFRFGHQAQCKQWCVRLLWPKDCQNP